MKLPGKIAIMGGGSWATALAKIVLSTQDSINWYMRRQDQVDDFLKTGHNPSYLSAVKFDTDKIKFYTDINDAINDSDTLIFATPSPFLKQHLMKGSPFRGRADLQTTPEAATTADGGEKTIG